MRRPRLIQSEEEGSIRQQPLQGHVGHVVSTVIAWVGGFSLGFGGTR